MSNDYYFHVTCPCCGTELNYKGLRKGEAENLLNSTAHGNARINANSWFGTCIGSLLFPPMAPIFILFHFLSRAKNVSDINELMMHVTCSECGKIFLTKAYSDTAVIDIAVVQPPPSNERLLKRDGNTENDKNDGPSARDSIVAFLNKSVLLLKWLKNNAFDITNVDGDIDLAKFWIRAAIFLPLIFFSLIFFISRLIH